MLSQAAIKPDGEGKQQMNTTAMTTELHPVRMTINPDRFTGAFGEALRKHWHSEPVRIALFAYVACTDAGIPARAARRLVRGMIGA